MYKEVWKVFRKQAISICNDLCSVCAQKIYRKVNKGKSFARYFLQGFSMNKREGKVEGNNEAQKADIARQISILTKKKFAILVNNSGFAQLSKLQSSSVKILQ